MLQTQTQQPIYSPLAADPILGELVGEFVRELPTRLARMSRLTEAHDWEALRRTAHQLRGAAGSYGFDAITPLAQRLELLLAHGVEPQVVASAFEDLLMNCQRVTADPAP